MSIGPGSFCICCCLATSLGEAMRCTSLTEGCRCGSMALLDHLLSPLRPTRSDLEPHVHGPFSGCVAAHATHMLRCRIIRPSMPHASILNHGPYFEVFDSKVLRPTFSSCPLMIPTIPRRRLRLDPSILNWHLIPHASLQHSNPVQSSLIFRVRLSNLRPLLSGETVCVDQSEGLAGGGH